MTVFEIQNELDTREIKLSEREGKLILRPASIASQKLVRAIREHKTELLELLTAPQTRPASTCARVCLADPTPDQLTNQTDASRHDAHELLQALRADGVRMFLSRKTGAMLWPHDRLCIEWSGKLAPGQWARVLELRAELCALCYDETDKTKADITQNGAASTKGN